MPFTQPLSQPSAWQHQLASRLGTLSELMTEHDLLDVGIKDRLQGLKTQIRSDKVTVAFVAEFSRGKSELINALFFAHYGRRIMPAGSGRTTMCPTELGYDEELTPCLRLLPIETCLQDQSLAAWRQLPEKWTRIELDVNDPVHLAQALEKVCEVRRVTLDEARALGFYNDAWTADNPQPDAHGLVEVPTWRHALVNINHPLLEQGLVLLDTPGLNAVGAEPELTVNLVAQAHAVIFILGADTGLTQSDLTIWREHLSVSNSGENTNTRFVVLNKIDTLWDPLRPAQHVQDSIEQQKIAIAQALGLSVDQVLAVSAQKGLVAKVRDDPVLLQASGLPQLELALAQGVVAQRLAIARAAVSTHVLDLQTQLVHAIHVRRRHLSQQLFEFRGLHGKNASLLTHLHDRLEHGQTQFDTSLPKVHALRAVHAKLLAQIEELLDASTLKSHLMTLADALAQPGLKLGIRQIYIRTFTALRANLELAQSLNDDVAAMLAAMFKELNTEFGFALQVPCEPSAAHWTDELEKTERSHLQYLGVRNVLKLSQPTFAHRLLSALVARVRVVYTAALTDIQRWNQAAAMHLENQLRERQRNFAQRLSMVERVKQTGGTLDEYIHAIESRESALNALEHKLMTLSTEMLAVLTPIEPALNLAPQAPLARVA